MASTVQGVLSEIEELAKSEYLPIVGKEKGEFLEGLVRQHQPCTVVEVGVMVGYATIRIANALGDGCKVNGIEIAQDLVRRAEENIKHAGLDEKVEIVRGDASTVLKTIPAPVDFVVLDGPKALFMNHLRMIEPKLRDGSVVVAHITGEHKGAMAKYFAYIREDARYTSEHHMFGDDGWEVSVFKGE